jgi:hypothetical protein
VIAGSTSIRRQIGFLQPTSPTFTWYATNEAGGLVL